MQTLASSVVKRVGVNCIYTDTEGAKIMASRRGLPYEEELFSVCMSRSMRGVSTGVRMDLFAVFCIPSLGQNRVQYHGFAQGSSV